MNSNANRKRVEDFIRHWLPYALVFGIVAIGGSSAGLWLQHQNLKHQASELHAKVAEQATSIADLKKANDAAGVQLSKARSDDQRQDRDIAVQRSISQRQEQAIHHLAELRQQDQHALVGLHDELSAQHANAASVRVRLELLEQNNEVARSVIFNAPAPASTVSKR